MTLRKVNTYISRFSQKHSFTCVLYEHCFLNACKVHRKAPVLASFFHKVASLQHATLFKKETQQIYLKIHLLNLLTLTFRSFSVDRI